MFSLSSLLPLKLFQIEFFLLPPSSVSWTRNKGWLSSKLSLPSVLKPTTLVLRHLPSSHSNSIPPSFCNSRDERLLRRFLIICWYLLRLPHCLSHVLPRKVYKHFPSIAILHFVLQNVATLKSLSKVFHNQNSFIADFLLLYPHQACSSTSVKSVVHSLPVPSLFPPLILLSTLDSKMIHFKLNLISTFKSIQLSLSFHIDPKAALNLGSVESLHSPPHVDWSIS